MRTLFPYDRRVGSVRILPEWISFAEAYARLVADRKGWPKPSPRDFAIKMGHLAFVAGFPVLHSGVSPDKSWADFKTLSSKKKIQVTTIPADDKRTITPKIQLRLHVKWAMKSDIHVLAQCDPPFVDFIGYIYSKDLSSFRNSPQPWTSVPLEGLSPIIELLQLMKQEQPVAE